MERRRKPAQIGETDKSSHLYLARTKLRACVAVCLATCLSLLGCQARPAPQPGAGASDAGPAEQLTEVMQGLQASATDLGQDHMLVELKHADGRTEFKADFMPEDAQYRVTHELYAVQETVGAAGAPTQRGQWLLPRQPDQALTHKSAIEGTLFLYQNVKSAVAGNYAAKDHYGCDLGPLGSKSSCSDVGACCDIQDQCYQDNGCTAASWKESDLSSLCHKNCNVPALSCVLLQKPGKSSCCEKGADYCGQTRNPGEPKPTQASPATMPRWDGVEQWNGTGSNPPTKKPGTKQRAANSKPPSSKANTPSSPAASKPKTPSSPMASSPSSPSKSPAKSPSTPKKPASKMPKSDSQSNQPKAGRPDGGMSASASGQAGDDDDDDDDDDNDDGYGTDSSGRYPGSAQSDDDDEDDDDVTTGSGCDPYYGCASDRRYCDPYNDPFCDSDSSSASPDGSGDDDDDDDD